MMFKNTMKSRGSLIKKKVYDFKFDDKDVELGKKATPESPHFCKDKDDEILFSLSLWEGKLRAVMYHSYDVFEELEGVKK